MCQVGFGAKGDMNNNHVLQLLCNVSWRHHERPSQYKSMYVSLGILSKEPPLTQSFIDTRWTYFCELLQWHLKYGKACLQLGESVLEIMPKSDIHIIDHFHQEVQWPMLQEALKVVNDHGSEWLSFPDLFGIGADPRYQSSSWYSV